MRAKLILTFATGGSMTRVILLLALCACSSSWLYGSRNPHDHVYPQARYCPAKVRAQDGHTAWIVDHHHWMAFPTVITSETDLGRPCALGFVDKPFNITPARANMRVLIPYVNARGETMVAYRYIGRSWSIAEVPLQAIGAPVLRDVGDGYPPMRGGYDAVVGVVTSTTEVAGLDEVIQAARDNHLDPYYNLAILDGHEEM